MKYLYIDNLAYPYALQSVYAAKGQWPEGKGVDIDEAIFRNISMTRRPKVSAELPQATECQHGQIFLHQHVKNKLHQPKLKAAID